MQTKEEKVRTIIIDIINDNIEKSNDTGTITKYRQPIIGFAAADDSLYQNATQIIGYPVSQPKDLLPDAQTVVSFFVPFDEITIRYARARKHLSTIKEWSLGYYELNLLIEKILAKVKDEMTFIGVKAVTKPVTDNYDPIDLKTSWPHKTSAYIAGIGTFGINRLIISPVGSAGRLGTIVIDEKITPTKRPDQENCHYKREGKCGICAKQCPTGALKYNSFSRFQCNLRDLIMRDEPSTMDRGCPLCSGSAPCGFYSIPKTEGHYIWIGRVKCENMKVRASET